MREVYTCIGSYFDVDGASFVRFNLNQDRSFTVINTESITKMPTFKDVVATIGKMARTESKTPIETIDVLTNYPASLKGFVLNNHGLDHVFRIRTTPVSERLEDEFINLFSLLREDKLDVVEGLVEYQTAMMQIKDMNTKRLRAIREGNETLNQIVMASLYSISWLQSQLIKHRMI